MAVNFQLFDLTTKTATSLSLVDERICNEVLNAPVHAHNYGGSGKNQFNWFDTIGFQLACGLNYDQVLEHYAATPEWWADDMPVITRVIDFLRANYTPNSFVTWGKR